MANFGTKAKQIADPESCWNRAADDEPVFVLLGRDVAASAAVDAWVKERIARGKNGSEDAQIADAERWANLAEEYSS